MPFRTITPLLIDNLKYYINQYNAMIHAVQFYRALSPIDTGKVHSTHVMLHSILAALKQRHSVAASGTDET